VPLATERGQVFMMAFFTLHPQESVLQTTAFEVIGKFLLHLQRQGLALHGHHIPELRVVSFNDLVQEGLFRSMAFIRRAVWKPVRDCGLWYIALLSLESSISS
jgi:hypothetical protein